MISFNTQHFEKVNYLDKLGNFPTNSNVFIDSIVQVSDALEDVKNIVIVDVGLEKLE